MGLYSYFSCHHQIGPQGKPIHYKNSKTGHTSPINTIPFKNPWLIDHGTLLLQSPCWKIMAHYKAHDSKIMAHNYYKFHDSKIRTHYYYKTHDSKIMAHYYYKTHPLKIMAQHRYKAHDLKIMAHYRTQNSRITTHYYY